MSDKLTEEDAKQKWCPLSRAVRGDCVSGFNRGTDMKPDVATFCIASACMAWRFDRAEYERGEPLPFGTNPADPGWEKDGETLYCRPGLTEQRQCWRRPLPRTGYCNAFERVRA